MKLLIGLLSILAVFPLSTEALIVTIQPIQICDNAGANCANAGRQLFEPEGDKIWAQAGIDLVFLPWNTLDNTDFLNLSVRTGNEFDTLIADPVAYGGSDIATVLNMWFANYLDNLAGFYGVTSDVGGRDIAIGSIPMLNYRGGIGRLDTIAHETGHSLGLGHFDYGAGGANNLMTQGRDRAVPSSINDINPDGLRLDRLTAAQIEVARRSPFAIPDPGTFALFVLGLIPVSLVGWKSKTAVARI